MFGNRSRSLLAFSVLLIMELAVWGVAARAQMTTDEERGLPANTAFGGSNIDLVNLQNGNLHVEIPILKSKQRGGTTLDWSLVFDTQTWIKQPVATVFPSNCGPGVNTAATTGISAASPFAASPDGLGGGGGGGQSCPEPYYYVAGPESNVAAGWRLVSPYSWQVVNTSIAGGEAITCPGNAGIIYLPYTNWNVVEPNGTQHPLAIYTENDTPQGSTCSPQTPAGPTTDGSGMYFDSQTGILTLKNGVQIPLNPNNYGYMGGTVIDPNGNEASSGADTMDRPLVSVVNGATTTYTAPLGQTQQGPSSTTYTVQDSNGTPRVYTVNYEAVDWSPDICSQAPPLVSTRYACELISPRAPLVISQITLPDGSSYKFTYVDNQSGEIQSITLPTGATISYTYGDVYQSKNMNIGPLNMNLPSGVVGGRGVTTRTVAVNGSQYNWTYNFDVNLANTTVTDPVGNVTVHNYGQLSVNDEPASSGEYEMSTTYTDAHGKLLRTVNNTYTPDYDPVNKAISDARLVKQVTTLENGQQSEKLTTYDSFTYSCSEDACPATSTRMNPTQVQEYDYGASSPGALLRTTDTAYQSFSIGGWTITKPQSVTVYNGSGAQAAQTTYEYDNYSHASQPMQASNAIQHSSTYTTSYTNRGNVTAISKWRNTDGAMLTSTNQYDDAGNLLSTIDPMGNKTSYGYTDAWANSSCAPSGQGKLYRTSVTNAKAQTSTSTFNSCTGKVAATTDANSKTTSMTYDLLNRAKVVTYPAGDGTTTYCYSDDPSGSCYNASVWSATETEAISASVNVSNTNVYDGLGRTIQSQHSDPQGVVYTKTVYDGDGRVSQVSNPFRTGDTEYLTTNTYDGIGRLTAVTKADNSATSTVYAGNTTTITDEAGNKRESQTDGLGRLTNVWEDPSGLDYETVYSYDVLGNLLQVNQEGGSSSSSNWRTRTYAYNSLGQLLCSANPEIGSPLAAAPSCPNPDSGSYTAGTVRYQYDKDGNLLTKIAPEENQQGTATVTTTYNYDNLNRLLGKSYSDGTAGATYGYDGTAPTGCTPPSLSATNLVGRMSGMCDGSGATAWSYDPMGRTLAEERKIGTVTDQIGYTYYLNGALDTITYPLAGATTPFVLTYNVNTAGRTYSAVGSNGVTYAQVTSAYASGAADVTQYGSNIQITDTYNARLQPLQTTAEQLSTTDTLFNRTYNFHAGGTPGDNGNLYGVVDGLDALGLNRPNGSVNYTYDTLNRVNSAATLGTACTAMAGGTLNWGSTFTVDAWGNLTAQTPTLCTAVSMASAANSENRLTTATYDSAGNMTQNSGQGYTYDAEGRITNGSGTVYTYDGMGERVAKAGSKLYWKGVGSTALVETNTSDRNPTEYIFFNGARIARIDPGATTPKYSLTDNLGSTAVETDSLGNILNESLFFPYGVERVIEQNDTANNYKFTGKERDAETGLDDFGARYYASSLGRFMTPDWDAKPTSVPYASFGDPQTLNLYSYVENGPLNKVDADGHAASQNVANNWVIPDNYCAAMQGYGGLCGPGGANEEMLTAALDLGGSLDARTNDTEEEYDAEVAAAETEDATAEAQPEDQQGAQQPPPADASVQQAPAGSSGTPPSLPSPRDVAKAQIEKANNNFDKCVVAGGPAAVLSGVVETGLDKGSEKTEQGKSSGSSTETKMATAAESNYLEVQRSCLRSNPTADLSPKYKGLFKMGDILSLSHPWNFLDPNSE
jgi:RHS repeat-associated protein